MSTQACPGVVCWSSWLSATIATQQTHGLRAHLRAAATATPAETTASAMVAGPVGIVPACPQCPAPLRDWGCPSLSPRVHWGQAGAVPAGIATITAAAVAAFIAVAATLTALPLGGFARRQPAAPAEDTRTCSFGHQTSTSDFACAVHIGRRQGAIRQHLSRRAASSVCARATGCDQRR